MVCSPAALAGAPEGWPPETLRDGEVALLVDDGGLDAINQAAHALDMITVSIVRSEASAPEQEQTVIAARNLGEVLQKSLAGICR